MELINWRCAQEWVKQYQQGRAKATAELLTMLVQVCCMCQGGCGESPGLQNVWCCQLSDQARHELYWCTVPVLSAPTMSAPDGWPSQVPLLVQRICTCVHAAQIRKVVRHRTQACCSHTLRPVGMCKVHTRVKVKLGSIEYGLLRAMLLHLIRRAGPRTLFGMRMLRTGRRTRL